MLAEFQPFYCGKVFSFQFHENNGAVSNLQAALILYVYHPHIILSCWNKKLNFFMKVHL
jgi:hypothetical protein